MTPKVLETSCEWTADDVADPELWTEHLTDAEVAEIDAAVRASKGRDLLDVGVGGFDPSCPVSTPLERPGSRLSSG